MFFRRRQLCVSCACSPTASTAKGPPSLPPPSLPPSSSSQQCGMTSVEPSGQLRNGHYGPVGSDGSGRKRATGEIGAAVWPFDILSFGRQFWCIAAAPPATTTASPPTAITSTLNLLLTAFTPPDIQHLSPQVRTHWLTHTCEGSEFDSPSCYVKSACVRALQPSTHFVVFVCKQLQHFICLMLYLHLQKRKRFGQHAPQL